MNDSEKSRTTSTGKAHGTESTCNDASLRENNYQKQKAAERTSRIENIPTSISIVIQDEVTRNGKNDDGQGVRPDGYIEEVANNDEYNRIERKAAQRFALMRELDEDEALPKGA